MDDIVKILSQYPDNAEVSTRRVLKKSGKYREIQKPSKDLRKWLRQLYRELDRINGGFDSRIYSVAGKSCIDFAHQHLQSNYLLLLDIKDYFPSIKHEATIDRFESLLGEKHLAIEVSERCFWQETLPQGFSTSTFISNMVSEDLLMEIFNDFEDEGLVCGIYVDDIAISASHSFDPKRIERIVGDRLLKQGYRLNKKTKYFTKNDIKEMVGVRLVKDDNRVILSKKSWEELYSQLKSGELNEAQVHGWVSYLSAFDRVRARKLRMLLESTEGLF